MDKHTPCATQFKHNKFGIYVPVCCSFKPKQNEKIWQELDWESKTKGDKIRTIIAYKDEQVQKEIVGILKKNNDVEIIAVAKNAEDTYKQILELKPEMVFTGYNFEDNISGLEIIRKSKETLKDEVPVFNLITNDISKEDFFEAKKILGEKLNTIIKANTEERYSGIIEDYKNYMNLHIEI